MVVRLLTAALLLLVFVPTASAADKAWAHEAKGAREALARSVGAGYITPAEEADYLGVLSYAATVRPGRIPTSHVSGTVPWTRTAGTGLRARTAARGTHRRNGHFPGTVPRACLI